MQARNTFYINTHLIINIIIIIFCNKLTKRLKNVKEISKTNRNEGENKENGEKFLFTSGKKKKKRNLSSGLSE
jgi:hypothetical protein